MKKFGPFPLGWCTAERFYAEIAENGQFLSKKAGKLVSIDCLPVKVNKTGKCRE